MSKRGGTELNHENWNQEEEAEDAGTFRKAAEGEMKGRVIKRARRRNAGGEEAEKKNVFAGFGGFANKPSATETFSFIGGPPAAEPVKPAKPDAGGGAGFVFGGSKPAGGAASAGFSFGSLTSSNAPAKTSFAFGSNSNEGGGIEKSAPSVFGAFGGGGEAKKDNAASAPPLFGSVGGSSDNSAEPAPTTFGSFSFGAKTTDSDSVSIKPPQISEPVSKASEIPSEPAKEKDKMSFGATSGFKFGSSSSEVKVSSESSSSSTGFTFGAVSSKSEAKVAPVGGFAFGAKSSEKPASSPGGFSFGSKTDGPKEKPAESSMGGGFAFGSKSDEKEKPASSGFSFGAKTSVEKPADKAVGLNFSSSSNSAAEKVSPNTGFAFGAGNKAEEPEEKKTEELDEVKGEDDSKSEVVGEDVPSKEYLSHLKALNLQVLAWLKQHIDQNPLILLSPVFKDYDSHLEHLTSKYGRQANGKSDPKPSSSVSTSKTDVKKVATVPEVNTQPPLGQAAFGNIASTKSSSPFSFGSAVTESQKPVSSTAPFSFGQVAAVKPAVTGTSTPVFGSNNSSSTGAFGTAGSSFSFGLTAGTTTTAPAAETENAEEEDTPPVVEIKQVTEEDAVYSKKCKLFYKKDGNYVEKGVGMLYLKEVEGGDRTQLLVRADTNLGNVLLNILLSPQIPTTRVGKNNVMLVCVPNPPVDPKADVSAPCPMLIRVKSGEDADELKEKIDSLKEEK